MLFIAKRNKDLDTMKYLYEKYKMDVPYYIRTELYKLTKEVQPI